MVHTLFSANFVVGSLFHQIKPNIQNIKQIIIVKRKKKKKDIVFLLQRVIYSGTTAILSCLQISSLIYSWAGFIVFLCS